MKQIVTCFLFFSLLGSCVKEKKAKDIVIEELLSPCDCVNSFLIVLSEINDLKKEESNIDSFEYIKENNKLEIIKGSVDEKCLIYEGADNELQSCSDYKNLLLEYELYEKEIQ